MKVARSRRWLGAEANVHFAFAGVALLLVLVNLLTPALLHGGLSTGGTFLGAGSLYLGLVGNDTLTFAVESQGDVQFSTVHVGLNLSASVLGAGFPGNASTPRVWDRWVNDTDALAVTFKVSNLSVSDRSEFLVNVSASTAGETSWGTFAFLFQGSGASAALAIYPIWPIHGPVTIPEGPSPVYVTDADLPLALLLAQGPSPTGGTSTLIAQGDAGGGRGA